MSLQGPILLIVDDDDHLLFQNVLNRIKLPNKIICFTQGQDVINHLKTNHEPPFLILCDTSLPAMTGLQLRQEIESDESLKRQAIPFIFMAHPADRSLVEDAYKMTIQGVFEIPTKYDALEKQFRAIIDYWSLCLHPNRF
ncbi:response regulator [Fibrella aquatica]|uniref:response regulator n=1 Tax=Fibrella aquatica TaxID=3242487 RepID=UPI0035218BC1